MRRAPRIKRDLGDGPRRTGAAMKFVIAFYRTRAADDAQAVLGRETLDDVDLVSAIEIAHQLSETLAMPQKPGSLSLSDLDGNRLYAGEIREGNPDERSEP